MAGGMNKRGSFGVPMSERVARTGRIEECPVQHCWVYDAAGHRMPGLLVERRHPDDGEASARVVRVAPGSDGRWALVEEWLPDDDVRATTSPARADLGPRSLPVQVAAAAGAGHDPAHHGE